MHRILRVPSRYLLALFLMLVPLLTSAEDWPTYLHDGQRSAANQTESTLSVANAGHLVSLWSFKTGGVIASSPTIVGTTVYVGSWDGYEYALDAQTGGLKWKTFLGKTTMPSCIPSTAGVTSTATVLDGVVYVGGGDSNWYALDAGTGAILWNVPTGDNSPTGGHYNWSSPLIYNGFAYIGVASFGDCPLVPGQLLQVDLTSHAIVHTFTFAIPRHVGGGIWTSPAIDPGTNTVYVTTGTKDYGIPFSTEPYVEAIVALDAGTLALKSWWQIPAALDLSSPDADWGTTPVVFNDSSGHKLVAAINKDGYAYAFDRTNLNAAPVWQQLFAKGGACPVCGDGSVASGAFGQGTLYMAGGITTINGTSYQGSVRAMDPATGAFLWEHGTANTVIAAIAYVNGLIIDGAGSTLEVLNATTGAALYNYQTNGTIYGAPSVANGQIFAGGTDGNVYAWGLFSPTVNPTTVNVLPYANTISITSDSNPAPGNIDGYGGSYSADALQGAGFVAGQPATFNGVTFQWSSAGSGAPDDVVVQGQTVTLPTPSSGLALAFLGTSTANATAGTGTITYTDGTVQNFQLGFSDWTLNGGHSSPAPGNQIAATLPYHNCSCGHSSTPTYLFFTSAPLQAAKVVASITLPTAPANGKMHIFALTIATNIPAPSTPTPTNTPGTPTATGSSTSTATTTPTASATGTPGSPTATGTSTATPTPTNTSGTFAALFNNVGITDDSNQAPGNFDSYGGSYSAQALQAAGIAPGQPVVYNGMTFQWPGTPPGTADNVVAQGQTITINAPGGSTLAFLGAASPNATRSTGTVTYSDGSTQSFKLGLSDWTLNRGKAQPSFGGSIAATLSHRNHSNGKSEAASTYLLFNATPLQAGKVVTSVTLPSNVHLHIFALAIGTAGSTPTPTNTSTLTQTATATVTSTPVPGSPTTTGTDTATNTPTTTATATWTATSTSTASPTGTPAPLTATGTDTPTSTATATGTSTATPTPTNTSGTFAALFNNVGITDDSNQAPGNFDSYGGSYSAQALQAAGIAPGQPVVYNGMTFQWPGTPPGTADNVVAQGQTITINAPGGSTLAFLGAASPNATRSTGTVTYSDGSTQSFKLGLSDWTLNRGKAVPAPDNSIVASLPYRNHNNGQSESTQTFLFYCATPLSAGKVVASVTLPPFNSFGPQHIFAVAVGNASAATATPTATATATPTAGP